jgi:hypothetical protein
MSEDERSVNMMSKEEVLVDEIPINDLPADEMSIG